MDYLMSFISNNIITTMFYLVLFITSCVTISLVIIRLKRKNKEMEPLMYICCTAIMVLPLLGFFLNYEGPRQTYKVIKAHGLNAEMVFMLTPEQRSSVTLGKLKVEDINKLLE